MYAVYVLFHSIQPKHKLYLLSRRLNLGNQIYFLELSTVKIRVGVINCNLIIFSKVIACYCNLDIFLITVIECK